MIRPSNNYIDILNSSSISPKVKIVVDGVEYYGDVIKTSPKFNHSATKIIGCFPIKTASFEMFNLEGNIDFVGKEITIYKGIYIGNEVEYIPQGIFIPQEKDIQTNISNKTISFKSIQDKGQFLDDKYESLLDWSNGQTHTGLEIVQEICTKKSIMLSNNDFGFANYNFKQPNFVESITNRQVIASLAEIGGETAFFNDYGNLVIKKPTLTNEVIVRSRYMKISEESSLTINTIVLGKKNKDDDYIYPAEISEKRVEIRIEDNPFVDLVREEIAEEVANNIVGLSYTPYQLNDFIDGYMFELNDIITIQDRNGNLVKAVILDMQSSNRLRSNYKLNVDLISGTNYKLAGSNKEAFRKVRQEVDHINQEIRSIAEEQNETTSLLAQTIMNVNTIQNLFQITGGTNLIKNSAFLLPDKVWEFEDNGNIPYHTELGNSYNSKTMGSTISVSEIKLQDILAKTTIDNIEGLKNDNTQYSISFYFKQESETTTIIRMYDTYNHDIKAFDDIVINGEQQFTDYSILFNSISSNYTLEIETATTNSETGAFYLYDLMLNSGEKKPWEPSQSEIYSTTLTMSRQGLKVWSTGDGTLTILGSDGFLTYETSDGKALGRLISKTNKEGTQTIAVSTEKVEIKDSIDSKNGWIEDVMQINNKNHLIKYYMEGGN